MNVLKKAVVAAVLAIMAAGLMSIPCRAQEIVLTVPRCGLWALDPVQLQALGEFEQAAVTFVADGAVVWLDDHAVAASDSLSRDALARIRIFCTSPRPTVGISPLYTDAQRILRGHIKIRCINPVF